MKISSIVDIVDGELLNSPSISFINGIKTDPKKVKISDLFIAKNKEDLEIAVQNGAYAIIFEDNIDVFDNEIAFIKVKNLYLAIIKLIRFKLSSLRLEAYFCKDESFDMIKLYQNYHTKPIFLIPKNIEKIFKFIDDIKDEDIIISKNYELLNSIYPNNKIFEKDIESSKLTNLTKHSLFELSFSYENSYFSRLKLSSLYLNSFLNIFNFFDRQIDISKLKLYSNFKAIFIDKNFEPIEFGKSDSFIICQNNLNLIEEEINYLKKEFKYAKTIFITKDYINNLKRAEQIVIENINELRNILKKSSFNCAYIIGFNHKEIFEYLQKSQNTNTLF
ncbi:hypothetical protein AFAEC_1199 [Aliarcobacter faecis]|uniref:hypothetical protein n=1 Tax=Aliarcobacter faecis TaxID=1564138 RepID=UPI00047D6AC0|nr:hypothetical protein [Aliarcobacter faecis]QKF73364.1 hypothetical protein AFAEC_1199 [Aliarcobacter faecis]